MLKKRVKSKSKKINKSKKVNKSIFSISKRVADIKKSQKLEGHWDKKMTDIINREDEKRQAWENLRLKNLREVKMEDVKIPKPEEPVKPKKPKAPSEYLEEDEEWEYPQYGDTPSDSEEEWEYENASGNGNYEMLRFPEDLSKPLLHQKLDDRERKEKELYSRNLQNQNLVKARIQEDRINTALYTRHGLQGLEKADERAMGGSESNVKNQTQIRPPEEIELIQNIQNLKNTELRKREFQQGIENLQAKHPLEVNQTLSKLYEILPTSQLNLIDNDGYQRKKFNPKLNIFNFKVEDDQIIKVKRPYLDMEFKKLKDYQNHRNNIKQQRDILDKRYNISASDNKDAFMREVKLREDDYLLKMANRTDPNKYLEDNLIQRAIERVNVNDMPTMYENINNARVAMNAVSTRHTGKVLYPQITPEATWYPSQQQVVQSTIYNSLTR